MIVAISFDDVLYISYYERFRTLKVERSTGHEFEDVSNLLAKHKRLRQMRSFHAFRNDDILHDDGEL